jgi:hypothetical protein
VVLLAADLEVVAAGAATAITYAISPVTWGWVEGMETPLYLALCLGALWAAGRYWRGTALTVASLASLTRPDGVAVLVAVVGLLAVTRHWSFRAAAPGFVLLAGWCTLAVIWFGSPVPSSGLAKMILDPGVAPRFNLLSAFALRQAFPVLSLIASEDQLAWIVAGLLGGTVYGALFLARRRPIARTLFVWFALYTAGFYALGIPSAPWYYTPPAIIASLLFWIGALHAVSVVLRRVFRHRTEMVAGAVVLLFAAVLSGAIAVGLPSYRSAREPHPCPMS